MGRDAAAHTRRTSPAGMGAGVPESLGGDRPRDAGHHHGAGDRGADRRPAHRGRAPGRSRPIRSRPVSMVGPVRLRPFASLRVTVPLSFLAVALAGCAGVAGPTTPAPVSHPYDLVIRNGRVLDGAGNPWIRADVAIKDGRFARIGRVPERGTREIDASGKYVSPGWIDMMDQSGGILPRNGLAENKLLMGVTTAIGGEGGFPVPASGVAGYFATLERQGISINFGSYFSETQARVAVLGSSARAPDSTELNRMRAILDTAMQSGAMGMTTALIYPPSSY